VQWHSPGCGQKRLPGCGYRKLYNLRTDPYEFADITSNTYYEWSLRRDYIALTANMIVSRWAETFKDFPPIQKPNTFTIGDAIEKMSESSSGDDHQEGYISLLFD